MSHIKITTPRTASGEIAISKGTKLFIDGVEVTSIESLSFKVDFGEAEDVPRTTVTFTVPGVVDLERE